MTATLAVLALASLAISTSSFGPEDSYLVPEPCSDALRRVDALCISRACLPPYEDCNDAALKAGVERGRA